MVQWIRIRLLMQGMWVWSLVWEGSACRRAADAFCGAEVRPYAHWHQEVNAGVAFAARVERELIPVFNALGFRLELNSLRITGLAPVPAA